MITSKLKDDILKFLVENTPEMSGQFNIKQIATNFNTSINEIDAILDDFAEKKLINSSKLIGGLVRFNLTAFSHDFYSKGGYTFEDDIFISNIRKLELEIKSLEKSIPKNKFDILMTSINAITSGVGLFA